MTPKTPGSRHSPWLAAFTLAALSVGCEPPTSCPDIGYLFRVTAPGVPLKQLDASGACNSPYCFASDPDRNCTAYAVPISQAGACLLVATAIDGRQAIATVDIRVSGPCHVYAAAHDVTFDFPALETDAAVPDGGDSDGAVSDGASK
jgi:hypothetical protein